MSLDLDYSSCGDEADDVVPPLKDDILDRRLQICAECTSSHQQTPHVAKFLNWVFLVDFSKSMDVRDRKGKHASHRRIDLVQEVISNFVREHLQSPSASRDKFSLLLFNDSCEEVFTYLGKE